MGLTGGMRFKSWPRLPSLCGGSEGVVDPLAEAVGVMATGCAPVGFKSLREFFMRGSVFFSERLKSIAVSLRANKVPLK